MVPYRIGRRRRLSVRSSWARVLLLRRRRRRIGRSPLSSPSSIPSSAPAPSLSPPTRRRPHLQRIEHTGDYRRIADDIALAVCTQNTCNMPIKKKRLTNPIMYMSKKRQGKDKFRTFIWNEFFVFIGPFVHSLRLLECSLLFLGRLLSAALLSSLELRHERRDGCRQT